MDNREQELGDALEKRKEEGLLRVLSVSENLVDFCSNDYLGFSQLPELRNISSSHIPAGATGSRLISGNNSLAEETEKKIAAYHEAEAALVFNTGYMANTGLFSCIAGKEDVFIYDEQCHASIIDGMRLSHARRYKFKHQDMADLEKKLQQFDGKKIVVVESVYSMDGDLAPLDRIHELCEKYNAVWCVDEAHATGIFGDKGKGLVHEYGLEKMAFARIITFGKALGLHGAAILGSTLLRSFLVNHARSFIYTTALPPHTYLQIQKAYEILSQTKREKLTDLITYFRSLPVKNLQRIDTISPIQSILTGNNEGAVSLANHLQARGFFVKAILSPTVKARTERIRICLHSFNTKEETNGLINEINNFAS